MNFDFDTRIFNQLLPAGVIAVVVSIISIVLLVFTIRFYIVVPTYLKRNADNTDRIAEAQEEQTAAVKRIEKNIARFVNENCSPDTFDNPPNTRTLNAHTSDTDEEQDE